VKMLPFFYPVFSWQDIYATTHLFKFGRSRDPGIKAP